VAIASGRGATTLLLATLAGVCQAGSWCAVVGMPQLGLAAAEEIGVSLQRLALIPYPGTQWANVVSILLDGFDAVAVAPTGHAPASVRMQLAARARQRSGVLIPLGDWDGADLTLSPQRSKWHGLQRGRGRLRQHELTVRATGRGAASRPRHATIWRPGPAPTTEPATRGHLTVVR